MHPRRAVYSGTPFFDFYGIKLQKSEEKHEYTCTFALYPTRKLGIYKKQVYIKLIKDVFERKLAKEFFEKFAEKYKVACCKVLSAKYEFASPERKNHCSSMVYDSCEILENILINNKVEV